MKRKKEASGITIFIQEEVGDARLRCNQLKDYINEAVELIEKSDKREHFFEIAGHLLHGIPDTVMRMEKSLAAAAMAIAKWDYEETKQDLRPEKAEQLEDALKDVRTRQVKRRSSDPEDTPMQTHQAAEELNRIAQSIEQSGEVDTEAIRVLIASLEQNGKRMASSSHDVVHALRGLAESLGDSETRPSRAVVASALRRIVAETMQVAGATPPPLPGPGFTPYSLAEGFEFIRNAAIVAYRRGSTGHQTRQAFDQLASLVSEIGLMCESIGSTDVPQLASRMSKAVRLSKRLLKPDVVEQMLFASDEKLSRFEEGKPADPTENMTQEDAAKWKTEHEDNKDNFKAACDRMKSAEADKFSRFEEGKPADPTENMTQEDAAKWKTEHEDNKDNFKAASSAGLKRQAQWKA